MARDQNAELEAAIAANPEDPQLYRVYGDWLQSQGDPRGELISIQHARLTNDSAELRKRETALLKGQNEELFGALSALIAAGTDLTVGWHLGFLRSARIHRKTWDSPTSVPEVLEQLTALPIAKHLRELSIGLCGEPGENLQPAIDALVAMRRPEGLERLYLGDFEYPDESDISATGVGELANLWGVFRGLKSLKLQGASASLGEIEAPQLEVLIFETGGLSVESVQDITQAELPKLHTLELWFGDENYGGDCEFDDLTGLLEGARMPALRHLKLKNNGILSEHIEELARAPVLKRLKTLDLSMSTLHDPDAEAFLRRAAAFKHLEALNVSECHFSHRGLYLLGKLGPRLIAEDQLMAGLGGSNRYVAVGE